MANPDPSALDGFQVGRGLISDQIYKALRGRILDGTLRPGQRLVESRIARELSVSQAPVREALRRLAHSGMVLHLPRRGNFVAEIDEDAARRAYELRAVLEDFAAHEYCKFASESSDDELASILDRMRDAAAADNLSDVIEQDVIFHRTVWESCGNDILNRIWPLLEGSQRAFSSISNRLYFMSLMEIYETHMPLIRALRARQSEEAGRLFREHVITVWLRVDDASLRGASPHESHRSVGPDSAPASGRRVGDQARPSPSRSGGRGGRD